MSPRFSFAIVLGIAGASLGVAQTGRVPLAKNCPMTISIQSIGGRPVTQSPVLLPEGVTATVDGRSSTCPSGMQGFMAGVLVHRLSDDVWFVGGVSNVEPGEDSRKGGEARWSVRDATFPRPDLGKGFEVYGFLMPRSAGRFPTGTVDYEMVRHLALSISKRVDAHREENAEAPSLQGTCRVELTHIRNMYGEMQSTSSSQRKPIEVETTSDVSGGFDRPDSSYSIYVVVTPSESDQRWVMPNKGSVSGTIWTESAYFGRKHSDAGESFRVQAFISKENIKARAYSMQQWRKFDICARSIEVLVKRRIAPGDLVIRKVEDRDVTRTPMDVDFDFPVEGGVEETRPDNVITGAETVWILSRRFGSDEGWIVKSLALVSADGYTFKANVHFSQPGRYVLMALASLTKLPRGKLLSEDAWYQAASARVFRRISRTVEVNVKDSNARN
jgi:hypothetical protein